MLIWATHFEAPRCQWTPTYCDVRLCFLPLLLSFFGRERDLFEKEVEGVLEVTKVSTHDNVADMLTKALDREPFVKLRRLLVHVTVTELTQVVMLSTQGHGQRLERRGD